MHRKLAPQISFMVLLLFHLGAAAVNMSKPNCADRCGNITIPYPFGIGRDCYMDELFEVICNQTSSNQTVNPPRAFIRSIDMELLDISFETGMASVKSPLSLISNCSGKEVDVPINLSGTPFLFSARNSFMIVGCNIRVLLSNIRPEVVGCELTCSNEMDNRCVVTIPSRLQFFHPNLQTLDSNQSTNDGCKMAFLVDEMYLFTSNESNPYLMLNMEYVPVVLVWRMPYPYNRTKVSTEYSCGRGFEGNPYLGCTDIDECKNPEIKCGAGKYCQNVYGSYKCVEKDSWKIILGICLGFGLLFLAATMWVLYKAIKKRNIKKFKEKNFKRNGGLLLQQQLHSSDQGNVNKTKIFNSKELEMATDNFNVSRILGQGGQGTVYKGMLADGKIVAVKKSKIVDEGKLEEFINEVVILSQINHRNVVKLLGCCLETQVPLLVYEFIPNGTLFHYLHNKNDELPLTWEMRLRIATEVSGALSYLHSSASMPIYHRDIKSTNILLDEKNRAKVADFGTSRSIAIDQTHLTTNVQGTFGYLDPEYFQSSQFTEKSDVYSFGVVLVELITGLKPILASESEEGRSLATYFLLSMESNRVLDIVDGFLQENSKCIPEIMAVADLAKRCLSLNGRMRPTMREVTRELEAIPFSEIDGNVTRNLEEVEKPEVPETTGVWDVTTFTSTGSSFENGTEFS